MTAAVRGVRVRTPQGFEDVPAKAVVLACGGFEANPEMRTRYLGQGWELAKVRGTRFNTGDGIRMALDIGAQAYGHWSGCHAVAWDRARPQFGNRIVGDLFQKHSYPLGIDRQRRRRSASSTRAPTSATTPTPSTAARSSSSRGAGVPDLRREDARHAARRVPHHPHHEGRGRDHRGAGGRRWASTRRPSPHGRRVQRRLPRGRTSTRHVLDGKATDGIEPPKSNWALPIDTPPYLGFAVTCGITFTFGGLRIVPDTGQVLDTTDRPISGAVRRRRAGRRPLLAQLPRRRRTHGRGGLRPHRRRGGGQEPSRLLDTQRNRCVIMIPALGSRRTAAAPVFTKPSWRDFEVVFARTNTGPSWRKG